MRVRALLAGALVLGLGATMTLAFWTDPEFATGSFTATVFDTESSTTGIPPSSWASHSTTPGAEMAFSATAMAPSVSHYAWINVRTTAATDVAGTIALASVSSTGTLPAQIEYRVVRTISSTDLCGASFFLGADYLAGSNSSYIDASTVPGSPVTEILLAASGNELRFCFDIRVKSTAPSNTQDATGTITWQFVATSDS
jgi:predicted ribosomally synthesized peptide with SipW-like signal peptide